jgi:hypothetical protein
MSKSKRFLNECTDCNYIGEKGLWKVEGYKGLVHINETYEVGPEFGPDPKHFDLDVIDAKKIARKYKITEQEVEKIIMDGEPICPKCKSKNFFTY